MRKLTCLFLLITIATLGHGQNPVTWKYSVKKLAAKTYEIHLDALVDAPWHIYSQTTPEGGPVPTKINFSKNPLVTFVAKPKEVGKLQQRHEDVFGVDVKYFDGGVSFVQTVEVKGKVKTNVSGSVQFMVCNDEQCLPPRTIDFSVKLD